MTRIHGWVDDEILFLSSRSTIVNQSERYTCVPENGYAYGCLAAQAGPVILTHLDQIPGYEGLGGRSWGN